MRQPFLQMRTAGHAVYDRCRADKEECAWNRKNRECILKGLG